MSTSPVPSITDEQIAEIEAAADAFPDYEWDSNTEPFFNGPSGESLGGGSTGLYCVYGQPFEIDGETYDGPTLVEACPPSQAKFICEAKPTIKALIARLRAAEKSPWIPMTERMPEPGVTVMAYTPPQPGDYPDDFRITFDAIDPESDGDYWMAHGEHYEHWCCIAKPADHDWQGPSEKAPYTHWMPVPVLPAMTEAKP